MRNGSNEQAVPLPHTPTLGQWDSAAKKWDRRPDTDGTVDLKALALKVLRPDSQGDTSGTAVAESVPVGSTALGLPGTPNTEPGSATTASMPTQQATAPAERADPYEWRMQNALRQLYQRDYPTGMVLWLEQSYPPLYADLMKCLPDKIHQLWSEHADLRQFEEVLNQLLQTHRKACALYRAHLAAQQKRGASSNAQSL